MHLCWLITRSPPGSPPSPAPIALSQLLSQYHRDLTMIQELRNEHLTQGPAPVRDQEAWPGRLAWVPSWPPGLQWNPPMSSVYPLSHFLLLRQKAP